jgi:hypothetical protein
MLHVNAAEMIVAESVFDFGFISNEYGCNNVEH